MNAMLLALLYTAAQVDEPGTEFYHDFRKPQAPRGLISLNPKDAVFAKFEPEGLRLTLPRERNDPGPIAGVKTTFPLSGDFEVTGTFEILEAETPAGGFGVGVSLFVQKAPPSPEGAGIYRLVKPGGKEVIYWDRSIGKQGEPLRFEGNASPCSEKLGRLRLKRVGSTLHFLWAVGVEREEFHEVRQVDFGLDDIKSLSMRGLTGKQLCFLDARFLDLRIRSGNPIVPIPVARKAAPDPETGRSLWCLATLAAVAVVAAGIGIWHRLRRRSGAADAAPGTREIPCPNCAKRLKVPAHAVGKTIKCPACAVAFVA
jgi:hypothetical protein